MTHNQIDYAKLQETKRANQAQETENIRYHDMSVKLGYSQLAEQARANTLNYQVGMAGVAQREQAAQWTHEENLRSVASREQDVGSQVVTRSETLNETTRHNVEGEQIARAQTRASIINTLISTAGHLATSVFKFSPSSGFGA